MTMRQIVTRLIFISRAQTGAKRKRDSAQHQEDESSKSPINR